MTAPTDPLADRDLLIAILRTDPDLATLVRVAAAAKRLVTAGILTFPLTSLADAAPLLTDPAITGLTAGQDITAAVPTAVFPVTDFAGLLGTVRTVIELVHRFALHPTPKIVPFG